MVRLVRGPRLDGASSILQPSTSRYRPASGRLSTSEMFQDCASQGHLGEKA